VVCVQIMDFYVVLPVLLPTYTNLSWKHRADIFISQTLVSTNEIMLCHNQGDRYLNKSSVFVVTRRYVAGGKFSAV
jgi:hypothetical protein